MWRVLLAVFLVLAWTPSLPEATVADSAVFNVIKRADPALVNQKVLYRNPVAPDLDLVIAMGSPAGWALGPDSPVVWWGEKQKLGLFLQEKTRPDRVYSVALAPGFLDCEVRIERATSTDTVVSCTGEKAYQGANQKFVYDIGAKALVSRFEYQPFPILGTPVAHMLQQQLAEHDLGRRRLAATRLALLAALGQLLLDDEQQGVIFQRSIGASHPGFPEILHRLGEEAIGELSLEASSGDHGWRSWALDSSRSRRNRN